MERKDVSGISTIVALLGIIGFPIVFFTAESYLSDSSSTSIDDDSAWVAQKV